MPCNIRHYRYSEGNPDPAKSRKERLDAFMRELANVNNISLVHYSEDRDCWVAWDDPDPLKEGAIVIQ